MPTTPSNSTRNAIITGLALGVLVVAFLWAFDPFDWSTEPRSRPIVSAPSSISSTGTDDQTDPPQPPEPSDLDPCDVLTLGQVAVRGYTQQQAFTLDPVRSCIYTDHRAPRTMVLTLASSGISELRPEEGAMSVDSPTVGEHRGVRLRSLTEPLCTVVLEVDDDNTVSVQVRDAESSMAACESAMSVAELVEPRLPLS